MNIVILEIRYLIGLHSSVQQYKSYISMSPGHPLGTGAGLRPASGRVLWKLLSQHIAITTTKMQHSQKLATVTHIPKASQLE